MSQENQVAKIRYVKFLQAERDYKSVSHDELNEWTVKNFNSNGMFESLKGLEYVRIYFDFDFHEGDEIITKIKEIVELLDNFKNIFGEYAYAGYCCDEELYNQLDQDFRKHIELKTVILDKPLSFHVVFYESIISQNELCEIMNKKGKYNHKIKDFADLNVYKLSDKEQLLRHPYAHKYGKPDKRNGQELKGVNFNNLEEPFDSAFLVATPRGFEKKINKEQWITIFTTIQDSEDIGARILKELESQKVEVKTENVKTENVKEIDYDEIINKINEYKSENEDLSLIIDEEKCLELILKCFEPTFESLEKLCCIINSSPFSKEILLNYMSSWYKSGPHDNPKSCEFYVNKYYKNERSNKWFYSTIKHLPEAVKEAFLNKFGFNTIDDSVKFDVWNAFTLKNLQDNIVDKKYYKIETWEIDDDKLIKNAQKLNKKYIVSEEKNKKGGIESLKVEVPKINYGKLLTDLKNCFVIIDSTPQTYIFKDYDGKSKGFKLTETHKEAVAFNKLKKITINYISDELKEKSMNVWEIICQNNNSRFLTYADSAFYSENPEVFSYYYKPFKKNEDFNITVDESKTDRKTMNNLELFWDHVKNVIAAGDEKSYNYIKQWIIRPLQKPDMKNKTALIIAGKQQGTGKSWVAEIISKLHGHFGEPNVGNMKTICGDFNAKLINKTLVVVNEVENVDNSMWYNGDTLKSLITDDTVIIEKKGIDAMTYDNCANFIFVSNNERPINIDNNDRRYAVFEPNPMHDKDDFNYWTDEFYLLKDNHQFLSDLYNWCLKQDISNYNPRNIPMTAAKLELIAQNRSRHEEFIIEYIERFKNGFEKDDCFSTYLEWCKQNNITNPGCAKTFRQNMNEYVVFKDKKKGSGTITKALPQKRVLGKVKDVYILTDQKYKDLSGEMIIENVDIDEDNVE